MRLTLLCGLVVSFASLLSGCASIVHGSSQDISVSSDPPGATVRTADGGPFTTPCKITMKRNKDQVLAVTKDGYQTQQVQISSVLAGAVAGNIIFGGIIGGAVDAATGAAWRLEPEAIAVTLIALRPGEAAAPASFSPLTPQQRLANLENLKKTGNISAEDYEASKKVIEEEIKRQQSASSGASGS